MSDDRVLRLERRLRAPPEKVFAAWIEPAQIVRWWGPEGMTIPTHDIDPRVGGKWMTVMRAPDGAEHMVSGVYRTIDPPRRLVFTWGWHSEGRRGHETEVAIELHKDGANGTLLKLTQRALESDESLARHEHGWQSMLNDLARHVEA